MNFLSRVCAAVTEPRKTRSKTHACANMQCTSSDETYAWLVQQWWDVRLYQQCASSHETYTCANSTPAVMRRTLVPTVRQQSWDEHLCQQYASSHETNTCANSTPAVMRRTLVPTECQLCCNEAVCTLGVQKHNSSASLIQAGGTLYYRPYTA